MLDFFLAAIFGAGAASVSLGVGTADGAPVVGHCVGIEEGTLVGSRDGFDEGTVDGLSVPIDGSVVGSTDVDGKEEGKVEGAPDGARGARDAHSPESVSLCSESR